MSQEDFTSCTSSSGQGYSVQPHDAQAEASDRFKQPTSSFNLKSSEKCVYDSRLSDSGVWSGSNIHSEEILNTPESPVSKSSDFTYSSEKVLGDKASYMRLDSGIDVNSVSQNLSELSVKDAESYNDLNDPSSKTKGPTTNINEQFTSGQKTLETPVHKLPLLERFEQNEDGDTQLHLAIIHKFIEAVYALVRMVPHPKYLNIKNEDRQTALHLAVLTREPRLVRLLVCAGASSAELDRQGNTALHLAVQADDLNSVRAIIDPITTPEILEAHLQYTPFHVHREIANVHNYEGQTCVHLAALNGNVEILRHLLWFGADINAKEWKGGHTCLHLAVERADARLCMFLLGETGIDADEMNYAGYTAYQAVWDINEDIASALRNHGVDTYIASDSDSDDDMLDMTDSSFTNGFQVNGLVNVGA
ncbi:NF-kappa-B inhibitor cactus-like isoform X2 [Homalodisca vitripennis]|uniref:NF-kappa-B inhibitor cactus-like isoform X2 n=1 Tax=Homalodisca vitripennis TaxID=197043 RepID=UPI001EEAB46E|nr:NF-kappa-B inhibitor cactus-like isoform X2 [Homalodisca vitripennis]